MSGRKLVFFRVLVVFILLLVAASVLTITVGAERFADSEALRSENASIADSLAAARDLNRRLDWIQQELEEIRHTRQIIENLATAGGARDNPE